MQIAINTGKLCTSEIRRRDNLIGRETFQEFDTNQTELPACNIMHRVQGCRCGSFYTSSFALIATATRLNGQQTKIHLFELWLTLSYSLTSRCTKTFCFSVILIKNNCATFPNESVYIQNEKTDVCVGERCYTKDCFQPEVPTNTTNGTLVINGSVLKQKAGNYCRNPSFGVTNI